MSHQTGISPSPELKEAFHADRPARVLRVSIRDSLLAVTGSEDANAADWRDDFPLIQPLLEPKTPSFVLFRFDDGRWLFVAYCPDGSAVRDRMMYAATRDSAWPLVLPCMGGC